LDFYTLTTDLIKSEPEVRWDRAIELYDLFESQDPLTECGDITEWSDLASFVIPQEVNDRITTLGFTNQDIEMGNTKQVNLDYHSVNISVLPDIDGDGTATPFELIEHIRLNWPDFADGNVQVVIPGVIPNINADMTWSFFNNDYHDIWSTADGTGTIVDIDTEAHGFNVLSDDATVVCSAYEHGCCWTFSTVWATSTSNNTPAGNNNGSHPVSGNRQFGLRDLGSGEYEFYIRAADRARISWAVQGLSTVFGQNATEIFYEITDKSWENLTANISAFVNDPSRGDGQGEAVVNTPEILRPDWEEVKDQLKLPTPLESIPCK
jgi:hypothetical protein